MALVAPDISCEDFISEISQIGPKRPRIALFLSQDDMALELSKKLAGGASRLGGHQSARGALQEQVRAAKIIVFDLTRLGGDDAHSRAFNDVNSVMAMVQKRLAQGQKLGEDTARTTAAR